MTTARPKWITLSVMFRARLELSRLEQKAQDQVFVRDYFKRINQPHISRKAAHKLTATLSSIAVVKAQLNAL